jgi:serine/threonine protein kinase
MDSKHVRQIEELYQAALACELEERSALLNQADPEMRREVELMLAQEGSRLDRPAWEGTTSLMENETLVTSGKLLGPYEIEPLLGVGGMGEVYKARDTRLGRTVAIKVLPSALAANLAFKRRFLREARAASALNHPNIAALHDISSHEGADFLVMEYVAPNAQRPDSARRDGLRPSGRAGFAGSFGVGGGARSGDYPQRH